MPLPARYREPEPQEFVPPDYFARLGPRDLFGGHRPLEVDLGTGDGSYLLALAKAHPERAFLGVERLLGRVRKVARRAQRGGLENVQILRLESRYVVEWLLPRESVSRLHLICPDPWPKVRHHRRRLIQPDFLEALKRVLTPDGVFLFKTDHPGYFQWTLDHLIATPHFDLAPWDEEAPDPKSDFQLQWEAEGKTLQRLLARPRF